MFDKLVDLIVSWIKLFFFAYTLRAFERGIVFRFGKCVKEVGPGLHFKWPFDIDEVVYDSLLMNARKIEPQSLTTKDDVTIVVSVLVAFQIEDVKIYTLGAYGVSGVLENAACGVVSDFVMKHSWNELRAVDLDVENEITKKARRRAKDYGIRVINVQLCDLTKSRSLRLIGLAQEHA
jgi:membrane protease subunit HflK